MLQQPPAANIWQSFTGWLGQHLLQCPIKQTFGIDCPGCGTQRSFLYLLQGNIANAWRVYPPGIFMAATIIFLLFHLVFSFRHGAAVLKILYSMSAATLVINYIYKILTKQL